MSLFQKSVLKRYLAELPQEQILNAYQAFQQIFNNPVKQQNILNSKEEQYQEGFLRELFVKVLGYVLNPDVDYNLITEQKNEKDSKKADGAILNGLSVIAVIELKSTKTVDLATIESQAFGYKNNQQACKYVITSNFRKLRFYIDNAVDFEEFDLFNLSLDQFKLLWICLSATYLLKNIPSQIKEASNHEEESVTKKLYADYAKFRTDLFQNIILKNPDFDKLVLFKKTQKLLDRFLFLFFAEDRGLVSPNWTRKILQDWTDLKDKYDNYIPLYNRFRKNFDYLNTGYSGKDGEIFAYNGGLFAPDDVLDSLIIDDDLLYKGSLKLSNYDFESEVDVNILGHIFEHSLNEIDEIQASLADEKTEKVSKRKKDGVFYTPKYITKYIVENTIGTLCKEQKEKLDIKDEEFEFIDSKAGKKLTKKRKALNQKIIDYRNWLLALKIVDPACGSGAFLNQALEFLIAEHKKLDELKATLLGGSLVLSDVENSILENNLYGVDINEEAVEIAKLSLWLRTARKGRKLNSLNQNLKCGNSLIDDVEVAGEKAFNWNTEFKEVFEKGGFDVVIGNPPWGAKLDLKSNIHLTSIFPLVPSKIKDTYLYFLLLSLKIGKEKGLLGVIIPNTWLLINNASDFRQNILSYDVIKIIDYGDNVFADAIVESTTLILKNQKVDEGFVNSIRIKKGIEILNHFVNKQIWIKDSAIRIVLDIKENEFQLLDKIGLISEPFDKSSEIIFGIKPYQVGHGVPPQTREDVDKRIYHSTIKESSDWKELVTGTDVNKYSLDFSGDSYIKYGKHLMYSSNQNKIEQSKILLRRTSSDLRAVLDTNKYYPQNSLFIITSKYDLKYLLALINSKLFDYIYKIKCPQVGKIFAEIKPSIIKELPIAKATPESLNIICISVENLLENQKLFRALRISFLKLISSKFDKVSINKKIENYFELTPKDFFKELEKQQIKLSLSEQAEWLQYFEEQKAKALSIKTQIEETDKEIDRMVYELYELTEEEIRIVEGI